MPITTREFSRTAAAFGTALALLAVPLASFPAVAAPSPTPTAEAEADSASSAGSSSSAGSTAGSTTDGSTAADSSASADGTTASDGTTAADGTGSSGDADGAGNSGDADGSFKGDDACENPEDGNSGSPCVAATVPLVAAWDTKAKTLKLPTGQKDPRTNMPPQLDRRALQRTLGAVRRAASVVPRD